MSGLRGCLGGVPCCTGHALAITTTFLRALLPLLYDTKRAAHTFMSILSFLFPFSLNMGAEVARSYHSRKAPCTLRFGRGLGVDLS
jgi:hypothetical protein